VAIPTLVLPKTLIPPDIRLVLSLTECGVNPSVYVPSFALPTCDTLIKQVEADDYMANIDVGEMFHNFMMHPTKRMYHGLNIDEPILLNDPELKGLVSVMMQFCRLDFGWTCAPYFACRMMMRAVELAKKHPENQKSAFAWSSVGLNLPGTDGYNPTKPWVRKLRADGTKASDALFFVDDGRVIDQLARYVTGQPDNWLPSCNGLAIRMLPGSKGWRTCAREPGLVRLFIRIKGLLGCSSVRRNGREQRLRCNGYGISG
jgi:hypothetical protein